MKSRWNWGSITCIMCFTWVGSQLSISSSKASNFSGPLQLYQRRIRNSYYYYFIFKLYNIVFRFKAHMLQHRVSRERIEASRKMWSAWTAKTSSPHLSVLPCLPDPPVQPSSPPEAPGDRSTCIWGQRAGTGLGIQNHMTESCVSQPLCLSLTPEPQFPHL